MKRLEYSDLSSQAYSRLKNMIQDGELEPGKKLNQEEMAAMLGISRMPLHKAFQMLESELLIESIPRRGVFVRNVDLKEMSDAFECREVLEGLAAACAASRMTTQEFNTLNSLFSPFVGRHDIDEHAYRAADEEFHNILMKFSGNQILAKMEMLRNVHYRTYRLGLVRPPAETIHEHLNILRALEERNPQAAETAMRLHIRKSLELIRTKLETQ